jgi:hypothetical protein
VRKQICTDAAAAGLGDNRDIGEVNCVAVRLQEDEADNDVVSLSDPNFTGAKAFCGNRGRLHSEVET